MAESTAGRDWTIILLLTALALTLVVLVQNLSRHATAYMSAPREVTTFLDAVDFSVQENESYDRDVARAPLLEDKIRLGRLLREIQKSGDDLREDLNALLMDERGTTLRTGARLLWASKRRQLEDRMRRLDMLRMRFLVLYMGIVKGGGGGGVGTGVNEKAAQVAPQPQQNQREKTAIEPSTPQRGLQRSLTEGAAKKVPLRRLTTPAMGHKNETEGQHKRGWFGVIQELQRSPKMLQRHATIETAMAKSESP